MMMMMQLNVDNITILHDYCVPGMVCKICPKGLWHHMACSRIFIKMFAFLGQTACSLVISIK